MNKCKSASCGIMEYKLLRTSAICWVNRKTHRSRQMCRNVYMGKNQHRWMPIRMTAVGLPVISWHFGTKREFCNHMAISCKHLSGFSLNKCTDLNPFRKCCKYELEFIFCIYWSTCAFSQSRFVFIRPLCAFFLCMRHEWQSYTYPRANTMISPLHCPNTVLRNQCTLQMQ